MIRALAVVALVLCARVAVANVPDAATAQADRTFKAALAAGDIDALERLGAERPITRWTDDAWSEAARLAVRANDFARARRALEQVISNGTDAMLVRRARAELVRLTAMAGASGEWSAVAAVHERLVPALHAGGDPIPKLRELEQLVRANPGYPRNAIVMLAIASGWEREGEGDRAIDWLRQARGSARDPIDRLRVDAELVRTLIRVGELDAANVELARLREPRMLVAELQRELDEARQRRRIRWVMLGVLTLLAAAAVAMLRRAAGSWRAVPRRLARPPAEALFLVPVAIVLIVIAYTGNPLVARAVRTIVIAGVVASWISGTILGRDPVPLRRALLHALAAVIAVGAATYLAVDTGQLIDFVLETWRAGHERG